MARIVIVGAGVVGLGAAMLLAGDGHEVTVLEHDPAPSPDLADDAWYDWQRRGVNQFRQPHGFQARFCQIVEAELPGVARALETAGAFRCNIVRDLLPVSITGGWRAGDERFEWLTGRRPFVEAVFAAQAQSTPGIEVRRGVTVTGLVVGAKDGSAVPHVVGVETASAGRILADLVVDMGGRRSALRSWLGAVGAHANEEAEDCGFMYFGRHFRSCDGSTPPLIGPPKIDWGTISTLTLPADNGTWCLGIVTSAKDKQLFGLRRQERWESVVHALPLVAHFLDGRPIDDGVGVITRLEDRIRGFVVDGHPVATGVISVGDAWAASNPTDGRGISIGMLHAVLLRDTIRETGLCSPSMFASRFHDRTAEQVEPWYRVTLAGTRNRLAEVDAGIFGATHQPDNDEYRSVKALLAAAPLDPDCLRAALDIRSVLKLPEEVFRSDPTLAERAATLATTAEDVAALGPSREQLVTMANA
jgi:flavin-dependent dehydrogenase